MSARADGVARRALLLGLGPVLAGCAPQPAPGNSLGKPNVSSTMVSTSATSTSARTPTASVSPQVEAGLAALEKRRGGRLGVYAIPDAGPTIAYRADERFALCSTYKVLAAAGVIARVGVPGLATVVRYGASDLMSSSTITRQHVASGMTLAALTDAALRYSDGTAGNLLVKRLGGPAGFTKFVRSLGDAVTRLDRSEPALAEATPGDVRDTSSPHALAESYRRVLLGDALPPDGRTFLLDLMRRSTTGNARIRAGVASGWTVADKTGGGFYGAANDIGVLTSPARPNLVLAVMTDQRTRGAARDEAMIAEAARLVTTALA